MSERLGIAKEEVACIGDGENDSTMFEAAGLRFAMESGAGLKKGKWIYPAETRPGWSAKGDMEIRGRNVYDCSDRR